MCCLLFVVRHFVRQIETIASGPLQFHTSSAITDLDLEIMLNLSVA